MTIQDDARKLRGEVFARQIRCPGPGHTRHDRSLSLKPSAKSSLGYIFKSFAGDSFERCADHIRERLGLPAFAPGGCPPVARPDPAADDIDNADDSARSALALSIWEEGTPIRWTPAEIYLRDDRQLRLARDLDWHRVLRYHKKCRFEGANHRAMIALYHDCLTDEPRAIHRTFLTREGHKIGRAMLGPVKGCAIKLDPLPLQECSGTLAIGEGIESTLAGRIFGYQPAWALGSAGAIGSFPIIPGVEKLIIFGENDRSGANLKACIECKVRWGSVAHVVRIKPRDGSDLNDAWISLRKAPLNERLEIFEGICDRLWPGAESIPLREGPSVLDEIKRIGLKAFGVLDE